MSHEEQFDITTPADTTFFGSHASNIRIFKRNVAERIELDHYMESSTNTAIANADGFHKQLKLKALAADPSDIAGAGIAYTKSEDGIIVPKFVNSTETVVFGRETAFLAGTNVANAAIITLPTSRIVFTDSFKYINFAAVESSAIAVDSTIITMPPGSKIVQIKGTQKIFYRFTVYSGTTYGNISPSETYLVDIDSGVETAFLSNFILTSATNIKIKTRCAALIHVRGGRMYGQSGTCYLQNISVKIIML